MLSMRQNNIFTPRRAPAFKFTYTFKINLPKYFQEGFRRAEGFFTSTTFTLNTPAVCPALGRSFWNQADCWFAVEDRRCQRPPPTNSTGGWWTRGPIPKTGTSAVVAAASGRTWGMGRWPRLFRSPPTNRKASVAVTVAVCSADGAAGCIGLDVASLALCCLGMMACSSSLLLGREVSNRWRHPYLE